jgi:hypothetical protein
MRMAVRVTGLPLAQSSKGSQSRAVKHSCRKTSLAVVWREIARIPTY